MLVTGENIIQCFQTVRDQVVFTDKKFVIEKKWMYVENANRASKEGIITVDNLEPNPKNPIIAAFFRNIGYADQLGSGVRKLFKYSKYYSGRDPQFVEDDVFRIVVRAWICTMCMITMIQKIFIMIMSMSLMIYRMQRITGKRTDDISIGRIKIRRVLCK